MKILPLMLVASALAVSACSTMSNRERRIVTHPEWYEQLSPDDQLLVEQGRIREGMNKNAVYLAWGGPDSVSSGKRKGVETETWFYTAVRPHYSSSIGFGYGYPVGPWCNYRYGGGHGYYGYPRFYQDVHYTEEPVAKVSFENNQVVAWESRRR